MVRFPSELRFGQSPGKTNLDVERSRKLYNEGCARYNRLPRHV